MNRNPIEIDQKSLQRLNMNFDTFARELNSVCKQALANLGQRIISQAQTNLRRGRNIVTSLLINSGAVKEGADNAILAGFPTIYAYYVEYGRRGKKHDPSLKYPPYYFIRRWVDHKGLGADDKEAKSIAFAIRAKIGEEGTKPHPFLRPAFERNKRTYEQVIRKGAAKIMNKDYSR